jgi:capsular polysaccharide biosynthesis protein
VPVAPEMFTLARRAKKLTKEIGRWTDKRRIVVLVDRYEPAYERAVRAMDRRGSTTFVVVDGKPGRAARQVLHHEAPHIMIDFTTGVDRGALLRSTMWAVLQGGAYVVLHGDKRWQWPITAEHDQASDGTWKTTFAQRRAQELADSIERFQDDRTRAAVKKTRAHVGLLRHDDADQILTGRFDDAWGQAIRRTSATTVDWSGRLTQTGIEPARDVTTVYEVPELVVREYRRVTCHAREVVTVDNLVLPDSFRHWQAKDLFHRRIAPASRDFGRLTGVLEDTEPRRVEGTLYHLDSAFPTHFGHLMTETLAKVWGWQAARELDPDVRPVMTHQGGKEALPTWKRDVLEAAGINVDAIEFVAEGEHLVVDRLVAAMPQMSNPRYASPALADVWAQMARRLGLEANAQGERRIFVRRPDGAQRGCANAGEVERIFVDHGFEPVSPETMPWPEQARLFAQAREIAGFAGSGLFNAMFNPTARVIAVASASYVARNEALIASVAGHDLTYVWGTPEVAQPTTGFSDRAYHSTYTVEASAIVQALTRRPH